MRRRKNSVGVGTREKSFIAVTLVAIVFAAIVVFSEKEISAQVPEIEQASMEDLSTEGFVEVQAEAEVVNGEGVVTLTGGCYRIVAGTEVGQAQSIRDGLDGVIGPRPNTHELMKDAFNLLDIEVLMVKVTEVRDRNFIGQLLLRQGDTILSLDSKPSDGTALAIRTGAKIYFNESLMKGVGEKIC